MADAAVGMYKSTGDMFYWEDDTHFNHIGHDFVGKKIEMMETGQSNLRLEYKSTVDLI